MLVAFTQYATRCGINKQLAVLLFSDMLLCTVILTAKKEI